MSFSFWLSTLIWHFPPKEKESLFNSQENVLRCSCVSCSIAWDSLTAFRGSIYDYSLQRHFQKSTSLLDPPGAWALFSFISFGAFNVTQHGIIKKGTPKAFLPPAGQQNCALLLSRGPNPVCLSVAQRMHLQLRWVEGKITVYDFLSFSLLKSTNHKLLLSSLLHCTVGSVFFFSFFFVTFFKVQSVQILTSRKTKEKKAVCFNCL